MVNHYLHYIRLVLQVHHTNLNYQLHYLHNLLYHLHYHQNVVAVLRT